MKKSGAVAALARVVFAVVLATTIGSRLSEQTMTMLIGAACGAGLTAPLAILAGMYIGAQRATRDRDRQPAQPPIVVMTPPAHQPAAPMLPTWSSIQPVAPGLAAPTPRQYTILGEETVIDGTSNVWS
jgi:hypothetical protein